MELLSFSVFNVLTVSEKQRANRTAGNVGGNERFPPTTLVHKRRSAMPRELTDDEKKSYKKWLANGELKSIQEAFGAEYADRAATYIAKKWIAALRL